MVPGEEIGLRIDQTLTQDATGTLVMLELEAMGLDRVKTEVSVQALIAEVESKASVSRAASPVRVVSEPVPVASPAAR